MLKYRLISFPLLFAFFLTMVLSRRLGPILFAVVAPVIFALAAYELLAMLKKIEIPAFPKTFGALSGLFVLPFVLGNFLPGTALYEGLQRAVLMLAVPALPLLLLFVMLFAMDRRKMFLGILTGLGVLYLLCCCYGPLVLLCVLPQKLEPFTLLFFLVVVTKMMDTGGYIAGKLANSLQKNGNHKIVPSISPGKSYEGAAGGLLFSMGAAWLFYHFGASPFGLWQTLVAGLVLAWGSFAGDLTESVMKRVCGVKDSNSIIPGMGGVLDVIDSFLYNGVIFLVLLRTF